jgi:hypothetical protein
VNKPGFFDKHTTALLFWFMITIALPSYCDIDICEQIENTDSSINMSASAAVLAKTIKAVKNVSKSPRWGGYVSLFTLIVI